jgi:hypothetical protein
MSISSFLAKQVHTSQAESHLVYINSTGNSYNRKELAKISSSAANFIAITVSVQIIVLDENKEAWGFKNPLCSNYKLQPYTQQNKK